MEDVRVNVLAYDEALSNLLSKIDGERSFPNLLEALNAVSALYHETWLGFASGVPIPGSLRVINSRGTYKNSIKQDTSNPTTKIIYSDSIIHKYLEDGSPAVDLKKGLLQGPNVRFGKNGPYNIVAFRHGVPSANENPMPLHIFNLAQKEYRKQVAEKTATKKTQVIADSHLEGIRSKRTASFPPTKDGEQIKTNYTWKRGKYAGMQRIDVSTTAAKRSEYITFRCVSVRSDPASWIRPPQQGIPIRQAVVDTVRDIAEDLIREAIERDLSQ